MPILKIVSRQEGFRRAGYVFGAQPVDIDVKDLTDDQVAALRSEPMLIVVESGAKASGEKKEKLPPKPEEGAATESDGTSGSAADQGTEEAKDAGKKSGRKS